MLSRSDVDLPVPKSPVQRLIYRAAQDYGLLNRIAAALFAVITSWRAAVVLNRADGPVAAERPPHGAAVHREGNARDVARGRGGK